MEYKVVECKEIKIVGVSAPASFITNKDVTPQLAKQFMPRLNAVSAKKDNYRISLQNYNGFNLKTFNPNTIFEKWIGVEVSDFVDVPKEMQSLTISSGNYLVIDFKGSIPEFMQFWQHIHLKWLPKSEFELDSRPHFERLPQSYSPMNSVNEEEIWIPVK